MAEVKCAHDRMVQIGRIKPNPRNPNTHPESQIELLAKIINKTANERMASTIRHNRARGKHQIKGMSRIVFDMLDGGMTDEGICRELGLEADELIRLKHITGFAKLFEDTEYKRSWETRRMIKMKRDYDG